VSSLAIRKLALVVIALNLAAHSGGCAKHDKRDGTDLTAVDLPTIAVPEPFHEFGTVVEGAKLSHVFTIKNLGAGALHIDRVTTTCGCTAAILKNKEVAPGGEGQVEVTFDTNHRAGDNRKAITVFSDDPVNPQRSLEFHAQVEVVLALEPGFLQLRSEPGKAQTVETWLTGKLKDQAHLTIVEKPADPELAVKIVTQAPDGGLPAQGLRFVISSKKAGTGSGNVTLATGLNQPDKLQVGYSWTVAGNIEVSPPQLLFSSAPGETQERVVRVTSPKPGFQLQKARIVSGPFVARLEAPDSGVGYEVHVSLKKGAAPPATIEKDVGKLELSSNDPLEPKKEVALRLMPNFAPAAPLNDHGAVQGKPASAPMIPPVNGARRPMRP